jgi:site-specific recombinase XerD
MKLEDLGTWWHEALAATASPRTRALYLEAVTALINWLTTQGLSTSEPPSRVVLNRYFAALRTTTSERTRRKLSPGYVNQRWRSLQQFYRWLAEEDLVTENPFSKMKQPAIPSAPVPIFTEQDLEGLFRATSGTTPELRRDRAILRVLLDCGIRVGELAGLRVEDVDFGQRTLLVTGKGSHARRVPFNAKCYTELRRWLLVRPEGDRLFLGLAGRHRGTPLTESGVRQLLNRRAAEAGVSNPHPHRFRHTAAHLWLAAGGLETDLCRNMGWRSPAMAHRYAASAGVERAHNAAHRMAIADKY